MADSITRLRAWEALKLKTEGKHAEALNHATELAHANPNSAYVLNVAGALHVHSSTSSAAWNERAPGGDESESEWVSRHRRAAVEAFSAAARIAPKCVLTASLHAEALVAENRFADAMVELSRVLQMTTNHDDPALHHVVYDVKPGPSAKWRKSDAVNKASTFMEELGDRINNDIVPRQAEKLFCLRGDAAQDRAKRLSQTYPYSPRAQLLRVYIELEEARAADPLVLRKGRLRRILDLISHASGYFDSSLLIALFHAKVLFALDDFDESERACRRALRIEDPTDPNLDDIPPAVSVPGADFDARVSSLRKQIRILLKQIIVVAGLCWSSIQTTQHPDRVISVRVDTLQEHYDGIDDQSAAKTISGAVRFLKNQSSWSFLLCPNSSCDGKKFVDTGSLWEHIRSKHRYEHWNKLQEVLGPDLNANASKVDHSLDGITLSQDSDQHDIFNLPRGQDMFESLLLSPSVGIQAESLVEMRRRKCKEGAEILEDIKKKLRMLPKNILSTESEEFVSAIKKLWLKFLETSALDHREVILPLARSFQWIEMKRLIALSAKDLGGIIGGVNIDTVLGKAPAAPDHQSGDNLQSEKLKPSCAGETLKADKKGEESGDRVVNRNSGTMVDQSSSDPPTDANVSTSDVDEVAARLSEVELDKKGTSGQSVKEMASTSGSQRSLNVFSKNNADKDLSILSLIIRTLCNLRHFRDKLLTEPLVWLPSIDNPCISQKFYEILYSWEKNDHHLTDAVLTHMKTLLCGILDCTTFSEKLQVGTNFASDIVATILTGLYMSETCSRCSINKETEKHVVNPITCGNCICPTHNLFGIKFNAQMSCKCGKCSGEYLCTALFHKLDAGSPQTTKIKSFAELPVLLDEQLCKDNNCEDCGSAQNTDLLLSNTPHFFTIVLHWLGSSESQDTLSEVLSGITSPVDTGFFCKSVDSSTMYTVTSMICCVDENYVCFARGDEDKWLIYGFETVETEDTWEHLLERFKDCKLQPEVLFFEVIK